MVNHWFGVQAAGRHCTAVLLNELLEHPAFNIGNPNKVRAVLGIFAQRNLPNFHAPDGSGYDLIGDRVIELNAMNPQMASALAKPLTRWRRYTGERPRHMLEVLRRIAGRDDLSADVFEVVNKSLP